MKQCWSEFFHKMPPMAAAAAPAAKKIQVHPSQLEIVKAPAHHPPPKKAIMVEIPYRSVRAIHFKEHLEALRKQKVAASKALAELKLHEFTPRNITGAAALGVSFLAVLLLVVLFA